MQETGKSRERGFYIKGLDGVRGASVLLVFFSHLDFRQHVPGMFGVNVFFLLSGFLITTLMIREEAARGRVSIKEFYIRRALRIFPPMYLVLVVGVILIICRIMPAVLNWRTVLIQCVHLTNYYVIGHGEQELMPGFGVYWSLAVEEHFYLIFPLVFVLCHRRMGARRLAMTLAIVAMLVLAWRFALVYLMHTSNPDRTGIATDTRIDSILWGCVLALWRNPALNPESARPLASGWICGVALVVLLPGLAWHNEKYRDTLRFSLESLCVIPLFCAVVLRHDWLPVRLLDTGLMRWLGRISYTFYLCHAMFIRLFERDFPAWPKPTMVVAALATSLLFSQLTRLTVEIPLARIRKRHGGA